MKQRGVESGGAEGHDGGSAEPGGPVGRHGEAHHLHGFSDARLLLGDHLSQQAIKREEGRCNQPDARYVFDETAPDVRPGCGQILSVRLAV